VALVAILFVPVASAQVSDLIGGPLGVERVAAHSAHSNGYQSPEIWVDEPSPWIQIDLGSNYMIDEVKLFPDVENAGWYGNPNSRMQFPQRFRIETAREGDATFQLPQLFCDYTDRDCDGSDAHKVETFRPEGATPRARYVRLTVVKKPEVSRPWSFRLWRFEVLSGGKIVSENRLLSDSFKGKLGKHDLLRPRRMDGEFVHYDHPENVTAPETWQRVCPPLTTPREGIEVGGFFDLLLKRNERYLLSGFTVSDMARDFRQRAGKAVTTKRDYRPDDDSPWMRVLGGSNAGRFLMGAGNQLRWSKNEYLRRWVDELLDEIDGCVEDDGYSYGFPERNMLEGGEEGAYARSWFTMGLIDAGIAGHEKAFSMARRANDWFNRSPYLPEMLYHASFGVQGMIPSTRLYLETPVGVPADIHVVQRYLQQNGWLAQLAARNSAAINSYPYDRPHSYLINPLNAYMDLYYATGEATYLEAATGGWEIFHRDFQHIGGTIAICEGPFYPAKSYYLRKTTGELCGNVFWAYLNQQFRRLNPEEEQYANEIEKSIYNALAANQCENGDILYHAHLVAPKYSSNNDMRNTCCEGQGTRMLGALPEFIYKVADDGIYVDLFNESTVAWEQGEGKTWTLEQQTAFPYCPDVALRIFPPSGRTAASKIRVRIPKWADKPVEIFVNGKRQATGTPGTYVTLDRRWRNRDEIRFTLPMGFRLTKYVGMESGFSGKEAYALEYGPLLMSVVGAEIQKGEVYIPLSAAELCGRLIPVAGSSLHFAIEDGTERNLKYIPYFEVKGPLLYTFTCYPFLSPYN
jgi:hypothetical protein